MAWSLYSGKEGVKPLSPLQFSNGKTQEDVVHEVAEAVKEGHKVIFIKGVCGTGKSAIALNLAKELGRASIVVPVKALQKQYEDDYTKNMYLLKNNGQKFNIQIIKGRQNFICPFLQEQDELKNKVLQEKEKNTLLDDFNDSSSEKDVNKDLNKDVNKEISCNNSFLPCKIEIKDKNSKQIKEYLKMNPRVDTSFFSTIRHVRRLSIAPVCPYWSPIMPSELDFEVLRNESSVKDYFGLNNRKYSIYKRKTGCAYYNQYLAYLNADAIVFNSHKYKIETAMDRKPATDVEIIDECDEFLDNFANEEEINLNRFNLALGNLFGEKSQNQETVDELTELSSDIIKELEANLLEGEIFPLKQTKLYLLLKTLLDSSIMDFVECDEENYCYHAEEVARIFEDFFDETYVSFHKKEKTIFVELVTTNLEKRFKELIEKNKVLVLMSGTIHSETILKEIFGISDFKIIDAEVKTPGEITHKRTGLEINCKYNNFQTGKFTREQYLKALEKCIKEAKMPVLIHVNAYSDLPTEKEVREYGLDILSRDEFRNLQSNGNYQNLINDFKQGKKDILYSTVCGRGADFPGETCNSIILTKYPYPAINSIFWKVLRKTNPEHYDAFYMDKARREFLQKLYRGLRSKNDHIYLLSPDIRVFQHRID